MCSGLDRATCGLNLSLADSHLAPRVFLRHRPVLLLTQKETFVNSDKMSQCPCEYREGNSNYRQAEYQVHHKTAKSNLGSVLNRVRVS